ncbi:MAG: hypothetical protein M3Z21_13560 [Pseudomonadota bacterium]|nr:hypothetical protein [Pseudomonadota bacterium]
MGKDSILEEIHRTREDYAARFDYDLKAIYRDLKSREAQGEFTVVRRAPRAPKAHITPDKQSAEHGTT